MCDDENVEPIDEGDVFRYFGDYPSGAGYVFFYQAVDLDLDALGLKRKPAPPPAAVPASTQPGPENLMDIVETYVEPRAVRVAQRSPINRKSPLRVDIPAFPTPVVPISASPVSAIAAPMPATTPLRENPPTPVVSAAPRPANGNAPSAERRPSYSSAPPAQLSPTTGKEKEGKWYQRKKSGDNPQRQSTGLLGASPTTTPANLGESLTAPTKTPLERQGTAQTVSSTQSGSTTFGDLGLNVPSNMHGKGADGVQGTPVPTPAIQPPSRQTAVDHSPKAMSSSVTTTPQSSLNRRVSQIDANPTRNRTVSTSSATSGSAEKEKPGGLSRRLSGMKRSGSMAFKLGLGKKDKDKTMDGVVEEERTARKGLLG